MTQETKPKYSLIIGLKKGASTIAGSLILISIALIPQDWGQKTILDIIKEILPETIGLSSLAGVLRVASNYFKVTGKTKEILDIIIRILKAILGSR